MGILGDTKICWTAEVSKRIHSVQQGIYELPSAERRKKKLPSTEQIVMAQENPQRTTWCFSDP
jgi:hypothetical protein